MSHRKKQLKREMTLQAAWRKVSMLEADLAETRRTLEAERDVRRSVQGKAHMYEHSLKTLLREHTQLRVSRRNGERRYQVAFDVTADMVRMARYDMRGIRTLLGHMVEEALWKADRDGYGSFVTEAMSG